MPQNKMYEFPLAMSKDTFKKLFDTAHIAFDYKMARDENQPMFAEDTEAAYAIANNFGIVFQHLIGANPELAAEVISETAIARAANPETSDEERVEITELMESIIGATSVRTEGQADDAKPNDSGCGDCGTCSCHAGNKTVN